MIIYMKYLKDRKMAIKITSFLIVFSILLGANLSLSKIREEAMLIFYQGERMDGKGIQSDLEYIMDQCYNLTVVAGRYMDKDDERIKNVLIHIELLEKTSTPGEKFEAKEQLLEASMKLYEDLNLMNLDERDQNYRDSFSVDVKSRQLIISHSSYNKKALVFNKCLKRFPANVLSKITFVKPLELYE
ncbi:MAG: hypothetical protein QM644_00705 [Mobilitalea sp.]